MSDTKRYLTKIARNAQLYSLQELRDYHLGPSEYECLHCVRKKNGLTHDELSKMMQIDKSAVTRIVTNLENKGYVTREVSESDRRCKHIYLTPEARDVKTSSQSVENVFYDWLFEVLGEEEEAQFMKTLTKLYRRSKEERLQQFVHVSSHPERK